MSVALLLFFSREGEGTGKRWLLALSSGALSHAPSGPEGPAVHCMSSPFPPEAEAPQSLQRTLPEPPYLALGRRSTCLTSKQHLLCVGRLSCSEHPSRIHSSGCGEEAWVLELRGRKPSPGFCSSNHYIVTLSCSEALGN